MTSFNVYLKNGELNKVLKYEKKGESIPMAIRRLAMERIKEIEEKEVGSISNQLRRLAQRVENLKEKSLEAKEK